MRKRGARGSQTRIRPGKAEAGGPQAAPRRWAHRGRPGAHRRQEANGKRTRWRVTAPWPCSPTELRARTEGHPPGHVDACVGTRAAGVCPRRGPGRPAPSFTRCPARWLRVCRGPFPGCRTPTPTRRFSLPAAPRRAAAGLRSGGPPPVPRAHPPRSAQTRQRPAPRCSSVCPLPTASPSDRHKIQAGPPSRGPPGPREPSLAPTTSLAQPGGARQLTATPGPLRWGLHMTDSGPHSGHAACSAAFADHPAHGRLPTMLLSTRPCPHHLISCPSRDRRFGAAVWSTVVPAQSRCHGDDLGTDCRGRPPSLLPLLPHGQWTQGQWKLISTGQKLLPPQIAGLTPNQNSVGKGRERHADRAGGQGGDVRPAGAPTRPRTLYQGHRRASGHSHGDLRQEGAPSPGPLR